LAQKVLTLCSLTNIWILYATVKKIWGSFDAFLRYRGRNFEILGRVNYTKFSPSWEDQSQIFLSAENVNA